MESPGIKPRDFLGTVLVVIGISFLVFQASPHACPLPHSNNSSLFPCCSLMPCSSSQGLNSCRQDKLRGDDSLRLGAPPLRELPPSPQPGACVPLTAPLLRPRASGGDDPCVGSGHWASVRLCLPAAEWMPLRRLDPAELWPPLGLSSVLRPCTAAQTPREGGRGAEPRRGFLRASAGSADIWAPGSRSQLSFRAGAPVTGLSPFGQTQRLKAQASRSCLRRAKLSKSVRS